MDDGIDRDAIKAHFIRERGYWRPWTEALLRHRPRLLERYATYAGHPARYGPLSERMVELIYVALDASATHLFAAGLRTHLAKALSAGASAADVHDVLHLVAAQGVDSVCHAVGILAEELSAVDAADEDGWAQSPVAAATAEHALPPSGTGADALQARLEASLLPFRPAALSLLGRLDPRYLQVVADFVDVDGARGEGLSMAERCLVVVALRACFTGFDPVGLRHGIQCALDAGCGPPDLLQAIQLGAHLAVHGTALGAGVYSELQPARDP